MPNYSVYGIEERSFVVDVEAENEDEAMRLVEKGKLEDLLDTPEYLVREGVHAERAELND